MNGGRKWRRIRGKKIIIISIITIVSIILLSIILTRPKYEILYEDLSLKDMSQITKKLDELNIKWKTPSKGDATTILVPAEMKNKIKIELASYGLPKDIYSFTDAFNDSSWTMTDYDKKKDTNMPRKMSLQRIYQILRESKVQKYT